MDHAGNAALVAATDTAAVAGMLRETGRQVICASDGARALEMCRELMPDVVVTDAVLPVLDGFSLAKRIRRLDIPRIPGVIVMHLPGMGRRCTLPGVAVMEKPVDSKGLEAAMRGLHIEMRRPDAGISTQIAAMLDMLGVPEHPGRDYLADAVFLAGEDEGLVSALTGRLYPMVARRGKTDAEAVERAMRRVIEAAWSRGSIEAQYEIFRNTIDAARGKPTCGEMIARLSQKLRREG